jgi:hypothetical protein
MPGTVFGIGSECQKEIRNTFRSEFIPNASTMVTMSYDANKRRAALRSFLSDTGLKEYPLEVEAGVGPGTIRAFEGGRTKTMTDETYSKLAAAATKMLGRMVTVAQMQGEGKLSTVPISSRIGAGARVYPIDGDHPLGYVEVPKGVAATEAWQVDGDSMRPLYGPRDLLFPSSKRRDPAALVGRIVGAQIIGGLRTVKVLRRGTRKGRWTLESVNPEHASLEDQQLEWVALIAAAIYYDR